MTNNEPKLLVSFSEIDTFRQCPLKHKLAYKDRWRAAEKPGGARGRGTKFHFLMETWYTFLKNNQAPWGFERFEHSPRTLNALALDGIDHMLQNIREMRKECASEADHDELDLLAYSFWRYVELHGVDENWFILEVEYDFVFPLSDTIDMKGFVDLIVRERDTGLLTVVDHKTGARMPSDKDHDFDVQLRAYAIALRALGFQAIRNQVLYNIVRLYKPARTPKEPYTLDKQFKRRPVRFTANELDVIRRDLVNDVDLAYGPHNAHQRRYDQDRCGWRCDFQEACLAGARHGDHKLAQYLVDLEFTQKPRETT